MQWQLLIGMFGGIGGAALTMFIQGYRDRRRRVRMANAVRRLLSTELAMIWFDLTISLEPGLSEAFPRQTEMWSTFKAQLPELLPETEMRAVANAYYWVKDFEIRHSRKMIQDYTNDSERARSAVDEAVRALGGQALMASPLQIDSSKAG